MATKWLADNLQPKVADVLVHANQYHDVFCGPGRASIFRGPALHFHRRALEAPLSKLSDKTELIYAVLASWGMHRMGPGGSKMESYDEFSKSLAMSRSYVAQLQGVTPHTMTSSDWGILKSAFCGLRVMTSGTAIVGNSKVLAHLLPNLVAPIDREHTLKFLFGGTAFTNDIQWEWKLFRKIHDEFYYPVVNDSGFSSKAEDWIRMSATYPWNTGSLKIVDNLVIGATS